MKRYEIFHTPLLLTRRNTWQKVKPRYSHRIGLAKYPKQFKSTGIKTLVGRALQIQGIRTKLDLRNGEKNHDWKTLHGFRKFFETQTERAMKSLNVEILMGHDIGLADSYYKPSEQDLLEDYIKSVDLLTIHNDKSKLENQVKELKEKSKDTDYIIKAKLQEKEEKLNVMEEGISLIISHFAEPVWPRTISTYGTDDRQVLVYNYEEALTRFYQANLLNCKTSAYPSYTEYDGINRQSPNFIFIDLDLSHFRNREALDRSLNKTLHNIKEKLNFAYATVLWSGNGYHIYLPVEGCILEQESIFAELDEQPSRKFIQWAEKYLSHNKSDYCHSSGLSFKNCMIRIPGSYNSKHDHNVEVKIVQNWNGVRPSIKPPLTEFYIYLADTKIKEIRDIRKRRDRSIIYSAQHENNKIPRIETLLQIPISDHRKYASWHIIAPYLINIRKLPYEDAFSVIREWLNKCDKIKPLDFSVDNRIKANLNAATKARHLPIGFSHLKTENRQLADLISCQMKMIIACHKINFQLYMNYR